MKKMYLASTLALTALVLAACGAADDGTRVSQQASPLGPLCGTGQLSSNGQPCYGNQNFAQQCYTAGGTPLANDTICRIDSYLGYNGVYKSLPNISDPTNIDGVFGTSYLPRLNPSSAGTQTAIALGFHVQPGDKLYFSANAKWSDHYQFSFTNPRCDQNGADTLGRELNSPYAPLASNEGLPQGLLLSNGTETVAVTTTSSSSPTQVISFSTTGYVKLGFNVPVTTATSCYEYHIDTAHLAHCENASYQTIVCP